MEDLLRVKTLFLRLLIILQSNHFRPSVIKNIVGVRIKDFKVVFHSLQGRGKASKGRGAASGEFRGQLGEQMIWVVFS